MLSPSTKISRPSRSRFRRFWPGAAGLLLLYLVTGGISLPAQTATNSTSSIPDPTLLETPGAAARSFASRPRAATNAAPFTLPDYIPVALPESMTRAAPAPVISVPTPAASTSVFPAESKPFPLATCLIVLSALGGFLLYHCGLTRAKNCAHTAMLLLLGFSFGLVGYWVCGFAVQTGGIGDAHAALTADFPASARSALDDELGFKIAGHHWGLMGSSGFFLVSDDSARAGLAQAFLAQAVLVLIAVTAGLGAALERARLAAMAVLAFLVGALIDPLISNWIWGGGWLAELGREFGLGHGVIDLGGAGVIHETAGVVAFALTLVLGPRQGRFTRNRLTGIPGHNVPFTLLGALVLLVSFLASACSQAPGDLARNTPLIAVNLLLGAIGAVMATLFVGTWHRERATPLRLTRALLAGAVSCCGGAALFEPWAAFVIGAGAGLLVEFTLWVLELSGVDDPAGATAIHGTCGAWGLVAIGLFANGMGAQSLNGVAGPVRGLFYGGAWHQLIAQAVGCWMIFLVVFLLAYFSLQVVQKILGTRVKLPDELQGLDWPQVGALGYQPDVESSDDQNQWFRLE